MVNYVDAQEIKTYAMDQVAVDLFLAVISIEY